MLGEMRVLKGSIFSFFLLVVLSPLSLVLFSHQPSQTLLARGDGALIEKVCAKSSEPVMCSECLKNNPASHNADAKALLNITIKCADADNKQLLDYVYDLSESEKNTTMVTILDACVWEVGIAHKNWVQVYIDVWAGQIDAAEVVVIQDIVPLIDGCLKEWDKYPTIPVPGKILSGLSIVKNMCDVVLGVIDYVLG